MSRIFNAHRFCLIWKCLSLSLLICSWTGPPLDAEVLPNQTNPALVVPNNKLPELEPPKEMPEFTAPKAESELQPPVSKLRFQVNKIRLEGNSLIPETQADALVHPYEGRQLSVSQLNNLTHQLNAWLQKQGYITTIAYLPPQEVRDGLVTIRIREGLVGRVSIAGNRFYRTRAIQRYLHQEAAVHFNFNRLKKDLQWINRLPGLRARATLSAGAHDGETDIRIDVQERQPLQISGTFDNQGRPYVGTMHWGTELMDDSVLGLGDRLYARWISATGTKAVLGSYSIPLTRFGTSLTTSFSRSEVNVDLGVKNQPQITGLAHDYSLMLVQPLGSSGRWSADGGVDFKRIQSSIAGYQTSHDDIRSLQTGLSYNNNNDRLGLTAARVQASVSPRWMHGEETFWKTETLLTRLVCLPASHQLILRGYAQMTPDALPVAEQFQLGGAYSVRGYTEGLLIGDRGYNLSIEDRFPIPGLQRLWPWLDNRLRGAVFFDMGQVWLDAHNPAFQKDVSNRAGRTTLMDAGFGFRVNLTRFMQGFADFGFGLLDRHQLEANAQPTCRIHFGIRTDLLSQDFRNWAQGQHTR